MKEPTQEDFEAWKNHKKWDEGIEVCLAWIYLCELFGQDKLTGLRCCAKRHDDIASLCSLEREKCWNGDKGNQIDVIRKIDTMVKEFVNNGKSFPHTDRVEMVLKDLFSSPRRDSESP